MEETNYVGVVDRGQEGKLAVQAAYEVPIELWKIDLLHSHLLATENVLGLPNYRERAFAKLWFENIITHSYAFTAAQSCSIFFHFPFYLINNLTAGGIWEFPSFLFFLFITRSIMVISSLFSFIYGLLLFFLRFMGFFFFFFSESFVPSEKLLSATLPF